MRHEIGFGNIGSLEVLLSDLNIQKLFRRALLILPDSHF